MRWVVAFGKLLPLLSALSFGLLYMAGVAVAIAPIHLSRFKNYTQALAEECLFIVRRGFGVLNGSNYSTGCV